MKAVARELQSWALWKKELCRECVLQEGSWTFIWKREEWLERFFKNLGARADMKDGHGLKKMVRKALRMWKWRRTNNGVIP